MVGVRGAFYDSHTLQQQLQWRQIKMEKMNSFKNNENIHKKEDGSYYAVSANEASSKSKALTTKILLNTCK